MSVNVAGDMMSPFLSQRQIELKNVDSIEIPAFAVVEVTGIELPEGALYHTPSAGRLIFKVRRATVDEPCAVVVNGPCPIPAGEDGKPGTYDFPTYALFDDSTGTGSSSGTGIVPTVGEEWGVKAGSFALNAERSGFIIYGQIDGVKAQVVREVKDELLYVQPKTCWKPGTQVTAVVQEWTGGGWSATSREVTVSDLDCKVLVLTTEYVWVRASRCGETGSIIHVPVGEYGTTRIFHLTSPLGPQSSAAAYVSSTPNGSCEPTDDSCQVNVCNFTCKTLSGGWYMGTLADCAFVLQPYELTCDTGTASCGDLNKRIVTDVEFNTSSCEIVVKSELMTEDPDGCTSFSGTKYERYDITSCCNCDCCTGTGTTGSSGSSGSTGSSGSGTCDCLNISGDTLGTGINGCWSKRGIGWQRYPTPGSTGMICAGGYWYIYWGSGINDYYKSPAIAAGDTCVDCPPRGTWTSQSTAGSITVSLSDCCTPSGSSYTGSSDTGTASLTGSSGTGSCWDSVYLSVWDAGGGDVGVGWDSICCGSCGDVSVEIYRGTTLIHTEGAKDCQTAGGGGITDTPPGPGTYVYKAKFITTSCGTSVRQDTITI